MIYSFQGRKGSRHFKLNLICNLFGITSNSFIQEKKQKYVTSSSRSLNQEDDLSTTNGISNLSITGKFQSSLSDRFGPGSVQKLSGSSRMKSFRLFNSLTLKNFENSKERVNNANVK